MLFLVAMKEENGDFGRVERYGKWRAPAKVIQFLHFIRLLRMANIDGWRCGDFYIMSRGMCVCVYVLMVTRATHTANLFPAGNMNVG